MFILIAAVLPFVDDQIRVYLMFGGRVDRYSIASWVACIHLLSFKRLIYGIDALVVVLDQICPWLGTTIIPVGFSDTDGDYEPCTE